MRGAVEPDILLPMWGLASPDCGVRLRTRRLLSRASARLLPSAEGSPSPHGEG